MLRSVEETQQFADRIAELFPEERTAAGAPSLDDFYDVLFIDLGDILGTDCERATVQHPDHPALRQLNRHHGIFGFYSVTVLIVGDVVKLIDYA